MTFADDSGYFLFSDCGMLFPLQPYEASSSSIVSVMNSFGITELKYYKGNSKVPSFYCSAQEPDKALFRNELPGVETPIYGPILFVGEPDVSGTHAAIKRSDLHLILNWLHHFGWPFTPEEQAGLQNPKIALSEPIADRLLYDDDWRALWNAENKMLLFSPCIYGGEELCIKNPFVKNWSNQCDDGLLVWRDVIKDSIGGGSIDVVAAMVLTVYRRRQVPRFLAHFSSDGSLVRFQINCFQCGVCSNDGFLLLEYINQIGKYWQLKEFKKI